MALTLLKLLQLYGFESTAISSTKLVRHQDPGRVDVHDLQRRGCIEAYQARQGRHVFKKCQFIVSLVGLRGTKALFFGVYQVGICRANASNLPVPVGCPDLIGPSASFFYELNRVPGYEDLENRVVIDWGRATQAWHQWLANDKEVVEILPGGQTLPPFRDYLDFTLTHAELKDLYRNEDANADWRSRLRAVAGVYLILATRTGALYVGSAYGADGIWGRWATYARNGHGNNVLLQDLLNKDSAYPDAFSFSILQILPNSFTRDEVLKWERRHKEKLGSRAQGLNLNAN